MTDSSSPPAVPPSVEECPLEDGSFVELHSLSRADMNGRRGEVVGFDQSVGRHLVSLLQEDTKTILIKPINLKRLPLLSLEIRKEVSEKANDANDRVQKAHRSDDPFLTSIISEARKELNRCIEMDQCCILAYAGLAQCATMMKERQEAVQHMQRAVANMHALLPEDFAVYEVRLLCELASCYGEIRDLEKEAKYIKLALDKKPDFVQGRFLLAQNLVDQQCLDEAIAEFQSVVDAIGSFAPDPPEYAIRLKKHALHQLMDKMSLRIHQLSNPNETDPEKTIQYADRILSLDYEIRDDIRTMAYTHKAVALAREEQWEEATECIREANDHGASQPPRIRCAVLYHGGSIQELRGDFAWDQNYVDVARACWEEAKALYKASEELQHDPATQQAYMRIQVKLNQDISHVVDRATGNVFGVSDQDVSLEILPEGPMDDDDEIEEEERPDLFV